MELELRRRPSLTNATLGELSMDGSLECFTLEDKIRNHKIPGETAIPPGRYKITVTRSQRFGRDLPLLNSVPGFTGIRIHPGNTDADTEGCILVGTTIAGQTITESRRAFNELFEHIQDAIRSGEEVWITVLNP